MSEESFFAAYRSNRPGRPRFNAAIRAELPAGAFLLDAIDNASRLFDALKYRPSGDEAREAAYWAREELLKIRDLFDEEIAAKWNVELPRTGGTDSRRKRRS